MSKKLLFLVFTCLWISQGLLAKDKEGTDWVSLIEDKRLELDDYDMKGLRKLAGMAKKQRLKELYQELCEEIIAWNALDKKAHKDLGHTLYLGCWMPKEEADILKDQIRDQQKDPVAKDFLKTIKKAGNAELRQQAIDQLVEVAPELGFQACYDILNKSKNPNLLDRAGVHYSSFCAGRASEIWLKLVNSQTTAQKLIGVKNIESIITPYDGNPALDAVVKNLWGADQYVVIECIKVISRNQTKKSVESIHALRSQTNNQFVIKELMNVLPSLADPKDL